MKKVLKILALFVILLTINCTSDDSDKPLCSEINVQSPSSEFIPCNDPESICRCG